MPGRFAYLAVAIALFVARPVDAQAPHSDVRGMFIGAGGGAGWTRVACDYCRREYEFGPVGYLRAGGPIGARALVGAELTGWMHNVDSEDVRLLMGSLSAVGWFYPQTDGPFYLKAGLGWVTYRVYGDGDDDDLSSNGPGLQLGAGYEFRLSESLTLTNYLNVLTSRFGKLRSGEVVLVDNLGVTSLQFGIGLTKF